MLRGCALTALGLTLMLGSAPAWAQVDGEQHTPGSACTFGATAGHGNAPDWDTFFECNSSTQWQRGPYFFGATADTCDSNHAGMVQYPGGVLQVCNGSNWQTVLTGTTTATTPVFANGYGFIVLTSASFNGNMGGLSGANADCLTDLTNNNWMGKSAAVAAGQLTSGNVVAWLCNSSLCQNFTANTTYYFAASGNTSAGGATLCIDANSQGGYSGCPAGATSEPSDGNQWSAVNYFDTAATYWLSNNQIYNSWDTSAQWPSAYTCNDWTDGTGSYQGITGVSTAANNSRWINAGNACSASEQLICIVQP